MICNRCRKPIRDEDAEYCVCCPERLCFDCWDDWGHCGHPHMFEQSRLARYYAYNSSRIQVGD